MDSVTTMIIDELSLSLVRSCGAKFYLLKFKQLWWWLHLLHSGSFWFWSFPVHLSSRVHAFFWKHVIL